ncbi:hypothetical protein EDD64_10632 [Effusibacillus lacus]|nr:hypothetical protein EDD64_10632 [Effusibacillus lacus]
MSEDLLDQIYEAVCTNDPRFDGYANSCYSRINRLSQCVTFFDYLSENYRTHPISL